MQKEEYVETGYSIDVAQMIYTPVKSSVESNYSVDVAQTVYTSVESNVESGYGVKVESCSNSGSSSKYPISSKTFWVAVVCIGLGVYLVVKGYREEGLQLILLGLGLLGVRDAIRKVEKTF